MRADLLFVTFVALSGCVAPQNASNSITVEYTSPEDEALKALDETRTNFIIPVVDERYASERLHYFFKEIVKGSLSKKGENTVTGEVLYLGATPKFVFEIRKRPATNGVFYMVQCLANTGQLAMEDAERNARNLSRFLQSGKLEKKYLKL